MLVNIPHMEYLCIWQWLCCSISPKSAGGRDQQPPDWWTRWTPPDHWWSIGNLCISGKGLPIENDVHQLGNPKVNSGTKQLLIWNSSWGKPRLVLIMLQAPALVEAVCDTLELSEWQQEHWIGIRTRERTCWWDLEGFDQNCCTPTTGGFPRPASLLRMVIIGWLVRTTIDWTNPLATLC